MTPVLKDLHWLPVQQRIWYKIALLTFKALHGMAPTYICDLVKEHKPRRSLRSSSQQLLSLPPLTKTKTYGDRSFSVAAPEIWNNLPRNIRAISDVDLFKKYLKTHLFNV